MSPLVVICLSVAGGVLLIFALAYWLCERLARLDEQAARLAEAMQIHDKALREETERRFAPALHAARARHHTRKNVCPEDEW